MKPIKKQKGQTPPRLVVVIEGTGEWEGYASIDGESDIANMPKLNKEPWPKINLDNIDKAECARHLENACILVLKEFSFLFTRGNSCTITLHDGACNYVQIPIIC